MNHRKDHPMELYSRSSIEIIREGGRILRSVMDQVAAAVGVGVTPLELDRMAEDLIRKAKARPAFKGLYGFPKTLCISLNEAIVHGIPNGKPLVEGDIVSIDCGVKYRGLFSDMATTVAVGKVSEDVQRLLDVTRQSLEKAIGACHRGSRMGDLGHAVQSHVERNGFAVVKDYTGHGVGRHPHEEPKVENIGKAGVGPRLHAGMVLAIEPMVCMGTGDTEVLGDDWTVVTRDRTLAAHYEHTVAITDDGPVILTAE